MSDKKDPAEALLQLTGGHDLTKHPQATAEVFGEVMGELLEERKEEARQAAKEQLKKAIELQKQRQDARKKFEQADAKFSKELGKLVGSLQRQLGGPKAPTSLSDAWADAAQNDPPSE